MLRALTGGASLILSSGAAASGGTVLSGATLIIPNGVVASNVTVAPGGSMWVQLGGSAIGTVDSGGVTVASGGLASGVAAIAAIARPAGARGEAPR